MAYRNQGSVYLENTRSIRIVNNRNKKHEFSTAQFFYKKRSFGKNTSRITCRARNITTTIALEGLRDRETMMSDIE